VDKIIVIGLIAHFCVEATTRDAAELGSEVTVVKDATRELLGRDDARRSGNQFTQLCEHDREHG
jgi:nicotinamidase-related amidase